MSEEFQKHAFESYAREGKETTNGYSGAGLGLSIVKDIVDMMNGTIKLESKENVGTKFTVTIPLEIDHNAEKEQQKKVEKPDLSGKNVLLVEDNELNLEIAKMMLADGLTRVRIALDARPFGIRAWWLILVSAIATAILGVVLLFHPSEGTQVLTQLLGISLMVDGVMNISTILAAVRVIRAARPGDDGEDYELVDD